MRGVVDDEDDDLVCLRWYANPWYGTRGMVGIGYRNGWRRMQIAPSVKRYKEIGLKRYSIERTKFWLLVYAICFIVAATYYYLRGA
jgi:hypothetical protein